MIWHSGTELNKWVSPDPLDMDVRVHACAQEMDRSDVRVTSHHPQDDADTEHRARRDHRLMIEPQDTQHPFLMTLKAGEVVSGRQGAPSRYLNTLTGVTPSPDQSDGDQDPSVSDSQGEGALDQDSISDLRASWRLIELRSEVKGIQYWRACAEHDESLTVEIKLVWPHVYSDDPVMWRFQADLEIEKLAEIVHEGIQEIVAWGFDEHHQCWWVALEEVSGVSLAQVIQSQALSPPDARILFHALAEGLRECHRAQISHRHIDPVHLILTERAAKLTRFQWPEEVRAGEIAAATALLRTGGEVDSAVTPRYDLLPPEWLDGVDGDASSDLYCFGACLLRALNPDGATWRDAPAELQPVIAITMHLDPHARGDVDGLCALLEQAVTSYLYRGTEDEAPRRLMLYEIVELIRADEVAWHMLGDPQPRVRMEAHDPLTDAERDAELKPWGNFNEVVEAIDRAKRAQPSGERDRSTQKALELLRREETLNQREDELRAALNAKVAELKIQSAALKEHKKEALDRERKLREELAGERSRAERALADAEQLRASAQEEYQAAREARALAGSALAEQDAERLESQEGLRQSYEQLRERATQLRSMESQARDKRQAILEREATLNQRELETTELESVLKERSLELESSLREAQRASAQAKIDATEASELRQRAELSESAARASRERAEQELEAWREEREAERHDLARRRADLQEVQERAEQDAQLAESELSSARAERSTARRMLTEAEDIAQKLAQERAAVDADLETVKREREVITREHSKLLEGQRELIDQTRRLTFRERGIEQREGELTREEHRVGVLVAEAERREQLVTDQETRIESGKLALLRERRELEDDRKALERERSRISGTFLALTEGRVERGENGEPLPAGYLNEVAVEGETLRLRYCPPGRTLHGSQKDKRQGGEGRAEERPRHLVEMTQGYWLSETPVTQRMWTLVMGPKEWSVEGDLLPADHISWLEAVRFCNQLSRSFGLSPAYTIERDARVVVNWNREATGYRLPTEAEWEHGARAAGKHSGEFPGQAELTDLAWYSKNAQKQLQNVGQKQSNFWQLYDLSGNIWEWCHDEWRRDTYRARVRDGERAIINPVHYQEQLTPRVIKGGAFYDLSSACRIAARPGQEVKNGYGVGIRLCLPLV